MSDAVFDVTKFSTDHFETTSLPNTFPVNQQITPQQPNTVEWQNNAPSHQQQMFPQTSVIQTVSANTPFEIHKLEKNFRRMQKEKSKWVADDTLKGVLQYQWHSLSHSRIVPIKQQVARHTPFPVNALPPIAKSFALDICQKYQVSPDYIAPLLLGAASIACRGNYTVKRNNEHSELVTLYIVIMADSGAGKSHLMKIALDGINQHEKIVNTKKRESASKKADVMYYTYTATPAGLQKIAQMQDGIVGIVGAEAGFLTALTPKNSDLVLLGYGGETYRNIKVRDPITIDRPCLSILISAQESALRPFWNNKPLQERGVIPRFLIAKPQLQSKHVLPGELDQNLCKQWRDMLISILENGSLKEVVNLSISQDAQNLWEKFYIQTNSHEESQKHNVEKSFYRKLAGTTLRLAGVLHLLAEKTQDTPISREQMRHAIAIARFFERHTLSTLNVEENDLILLCEKTINFLADYAGRQIEVRDIYRHLHIKRHELSPVIEKLVAHNFIRIIKDGRKELCLVHPSL